MNPEVPEIALQVRGISKTFGATRALVNASFNGWHGGYSIGPRYVLQIVPLLALVPLLASGQQNESEFYALPRTAPEFWRAAQFEIRTGSYERAAEVLVTGRTHRLIRRRETYEDLVRAEEDCNP